MEKGSSDSLAKLTAEELEGRLIEFAVRIIKLCAHLPKTPAGKHIAGQILRSGTSPAPNYGEARGAESHADYAYYIWLFHFEPPGLVTFRASERRRQPDSVPAISAVTRLA